MKLIYPAIFTPCTEKEGYTVEVPDLPGCVSEGDSLIEANSNNLIKTILQGTVKLKQLQ